MPIDHAPRATPEHCYMERWFWTASQLANACGVDRETLDELIAADCGPGPIYAFDGARWWSALAASNGNAPTTPTVGANAWFAPGAAWSLRTAIANMRDGMDAKIAAAFNRDRFANDFLEGLEHIKIAAIGFPGCFSNEGLVRADAARGAADEEWRSWLDGAYGVCLRVFTAETCILKESLAAKLKRQPDVGSGAGDDISVLECAERLAGLILPFAPWERSSGTPGVAIDRLLTARQLGQKLPYP